MNEKISDDLKEWFGFQGVLGGPEYDSFPAWKQLVADALLAKGMDYRIVSINMDTACDSAIQYAKEVRKTVNDPELAVPLWAKFPNVEKLYHTRCMLAENIQMLIKIYNAG